MTDLSAIGVQSGSRKLRVAVLVDGENVRAEYAGEIISKSLSAGDLMVRRVYGNAAILKKWQTAPGFRIMHSGTGKNATDILLAVEAMSLVLTKLVDVLVIVSSDKDFTHLATNLREAGYPVIGMGEGKTTEAFRKSCVRFEVLPELADDGTALKPLVLPVREFSEIDRQIQNLVISDGASGTIGVAKLGSLLRQKHNTLSKDGACATWSAYLRKHSDIYDYAANSGDPKVRLKQPQPHIVP